MKSSFKAGRDLESGNDALLDEKVKKNTSYELTGFRRCCFDCESMFDVSAWRGIDRILFCFRFCSYVDVVFSLIASVLVGTSTSGKQIPVISITVNLINVFLALLAVNASLQLREHSIQIVVILSAILEVVYPSIMIWQTKNGFEFSIEVLRLVLGIPTIVFGQIAASRLKKMKRNRVIIMFCGLDGSGKSLLLDCIQNQSGIQDEWEVNPTGGLEMHEFRRFGVFWRIWDMSGTSRGRNLWPRFFRTVHAIAFVINGSDLKRMHVIREEFLAISQHPDVVQRNIPILVFLNKIDLPGRKGQKISATELSSFLQLASVPVNTHIQPSSAIREEGIDEGLHWILESI